MVEHRYSRIFDLPPTFLKRRDLDVLQEVVRSGMQSGRFNSFEITVQNNDAAFAAGTVDELLSQNLPNSTDRPVDNLKRRRRHHQSERESHPLP
jgi:hypothetical protein